MQHLVEAKGAGQIVDPAGRVIGFSLRGTAEDQNGNPGEAGVEFGDELGAADSGHVEAGDDEAEIAGEVRLFNQAKGFRRIADAPPRLAPYLAAALACNLTLGALLENFGDMLWTVSLGIALIASDVAARSQYRTTRPSAAGLALF